MPLALLLLVCVLPVAAAWGFYLHPELLPGKRANFGELIEPPRPLRDIRLLTAAGKDFRLEEVRGTWSLLWLASQPCNDECASPLRGMRNIRSALRENGARLRSFAIPLTAPANELRDGFYLVDPFGNLVMRYEANADFKGILRDLERLLKYSRR